MRRFLRSFADGGNIGAPLNPLSLGPFLSLNAKTGLAGTTEGALIALWPDESGNGHDGSQGVNAQKPVYHTSISANGGPLVTFLGTNDVQNPSNIGGGLGTNPSIATGYDLLAYGQFSPAPAGRAFPSSQLFQGVPGSRPGCFYEEDSGPLLRRYQLQSANTSDVFGDTFGIGYYGLQRWRFVPATATTGTCTVFANSTQVLSGFYSFNPLAASSWAIGDPTALNRSPKCDLGAFVWYTKVLTDGQVARIKAFWKGQFG